LTDEKERPVEIYQTPIIAWEILESEEDQTVPLYGEYSDRTYVDYHLTEAQPIVSPGEGIDRNSAWAILLPDGRVVAPFIATFDNITLYLKDCQEEWDSLHTEVTK
jgi:hypothetical protein